MLVNREGFVADPSYEHLVDILYRTAIYLSVRVGLRPSSKPVPSVARNAKASHQRRADLKQAIEHSVGRAAELAQEAQQFAAKGDYRAASSRIEQAAAEFSGPRKSPNG